MAHAAGHVQVARPVGEVFRWIADPELAARWQPEVTSYAITRRAEGMIGTEFVETISGRGGTAELQGRIVDYRPDGLIAFALEGPGVRVRARYTVESTPTGTVVAADVTVDPARRVPVLLRPIVGWGMRRRLRRELDRLRRLIEGAPPDTGEARSDPTDRVAAMPGTRATESGVDLAIVCAGLTKDYGAGHGLFDLDLQVRRGEVFGFIGANGAGKTTTIRLLMDLVRPDRGSATVLGLDARRDSLEVKRRVGYLPGELPRYPGVTAGHVVGLLAGLRGGVDVARIAALADRFELDLGRKFEDLSHGNKQKVGLIQAFMHQPELLLLDEPTLGLDPLMQREFRNLVEESVTAGATVLLSSHVLAEVERSCDRIGLIRAGRLLRTGTLEELRELRVHRLEAIVEGDPDQRALATISGVSDAAVEDHHVTCSVHGPVGPLLDWLSTYRVIELDSRELSLEEVFFSEFESAA